MFFNVYGLAIKPLVTAYKPLVNYGLVGVNDIVKLIHCLSMLYRPEIIINN